MQQLGGWLLEARGHTASAGTPSHYEPLFLLYLACSVAALAATLLVREKGLKRYPCRDREKEEEESRAAPDQ